MTTAESNEASKTSATASRIVLTSPATTGPVAYSARLTPIRPSSFVFRGAAGSVLSVKNCELELALTELIRICTCEPGIRAMLDPFRKNAKTSLNSEPTNSLYSSEPKAYRNDTTSWAGMNENSSTAALKVEAPTSCESC